MFDIKVGLWRTTDAPNCKVCSYIQNLIDNSMETLIYQSNRTEDEEEKKKYASILKLYRDTRISMADSKHNSMILKLLKTDGVFIVLNPKFCSKFALNL